MFETLTGKLNQAFRSLTGRNRISEANVREVMREVRTALLEADVNFNVARQFCDNVVTKAIGKQVTQSSRPDELMVKIVFEEMVALMGPVDPSIPYVSPGPTVLMLAGLQGSGKTTTAGKLALYIQKEHKRRPMLVAADLQRPAAIEQLKVLGAQLNVPVYAEEANKDPVAVCRNAVKAATSHNADVVILDTAGRLAIDEPLMEELKRVSSAVNPHQVYLVVDAMIGQDSVNTAKSFNDKLELDGVILTKLDGDARGGAALTVKSITGKPIKFCGVGEKLTGLEPFNPEQMAIRILGKPDLMAMIKNAQQAIDADRARELQEKMAKGKFNLDMFVELMGSVKKMGSISSILGMMGMGSQLSGMNIDDRDLDRVVAMVKSMTPKERANPELIEASRRRRIARGSGTTPEDVAALLKQFAQMRPMMEQVANMSFLGRLKMMSQLAQMDLSALGNKFPSHLLPNQRTGDTSNIDRQKLKEKLKRRAKR